MDKKIIGVIVIVVAMAVGLFIGLNDTNYIKETNSNKLFSGDNEKKISGDITENISGEITIDNSGETIESGEIIDIPVINEFVPDNVRAVYATGWVMGTPSIRKNMIDKIKENGFNAIVIDIKDEAGQLSYTSEVQTAIDIKASRKMISNIKSVIEELKENEIYVIGRIVTFKDPIYASNISEIAYKKSDGTTWKDSNGRAWPNPYNTKSWNYPIALAKEAATLGFQEIQFDYVRFPSSEGRTKTIAYGFDSATKSKSDTINAFLEKVMEELKPYNVPVSVDVFGITTKRDGDFENIGQDFAKISKIVDIVCPMIYPSHYNFNEYGIAKPDLNPYKLIQRSLEDAYKRFNTLASGDTTVKFAKIRPYLQDFTASWLGKGNYLVYGEKEVADQIQAAYDCGIYDFCLWDPNNKYCYTALSKVSISSEITNKTY